MLTLKEMKALIVPLQQKTRKPSTMVEPKVVTLELHVQWPKEMLATAMEAEF